MPSQSDSRRLLREHLALQAETEAILQDHKALELKPFDAAAHRAHHERLATHRQSLRLHAATFSGATRVMRREIERRVKRPA
jgi:hypothetical protein